MRVAFAGRTDAGVHAWGQVAAFDTASAHPLSTFVEGLTYWLPRDIAVVRAVEAPPGFDPRRHAVSRTYRYLVLNRRARSPLWAFRAWHVRDPLDLAPMRRLIEWLPGRRDWAAVAGDAGGRSTVRTLTRAELRAKGPLLAFEFEAPSFLPHQVRRTVGALVDAGAGRRAVETLIEQIERAAPASVGPVAPPHGLYLARVAYREIDLRPPGANEPEEPDE